MMPVTLATMALGGLLLVAAADHPPTLNIGPTCSGDRRDASPTAKPGQCEKSEQDARSTLESEWSSFSAADRHQCLAVTHIGGYPSYVQVLTCLEIARDVRRLPRG